MRRGIQVILNLRPSDGVSCRRGNSDINWWEFTFIHSLNFYLEWWACGRRIISEHISPAPNEILFVLANFDVSLFSAVCSFAFLHSPVLALVTSFVPSPWTGPGICGIQTTWS
ncbi:hypothetical protein PSPO01_01932 [Paraphaeosphaeria sporulosa]